MTFHDLWGKGWKGFRVPTDIFDTITLYNHSLGKNNIALALVEGRGGIGQECTRKSSFIPDYQIPFLFLYNFPKTGATYYAIQEMPLGVSNMILSSKPVFTIIFARCRLQSWPSTCVTCPTCPVNPSVSDLSKSSISTVCPI